MLCLLSNAVSASSLLNEETWAWWEAKCWTAAWGARRARRSLTLSINQLRAKSGSQIIHLKAAFFSGTDCVNTWSQTGGVVSASCMTAWILDRRSWIIAEGCQGSAVSVELLKSMKQRNNHFQCCSLSQKYNEFVQTPKRNWWKENKHFY